MKTSGAARVRFLAPALLSIVLLAGCSTVATYKSQTDAGPARPVDYPILVYTEDETVPRPCEVIGTISVHGGSFTMFGGSVENEMKKVLQTAREKGADAVQMKSVERPCFSNANYRLVADLLRYTDPWETVAITEQEFANYLKANRRNRDPIEGVWDGREGAPVRIGIMRNTSKPGRDFIGFILNTENPTWRKGYKKIDIKGGPQPGSYVLGYYFDDFSKQETSIILGRKTAFALAVPTTDEKTAIITYSRNRAIP
ncbi:MAG TPA: hypothetical protein VN836_06875 [Verrucomicrobiae bacterium]|nr:hypothetical protein [Verrucomicrobiae bacterium]